MKTVFLNLASLLNYFECLVEGVGNLIEGAVGILSDHLVGVALVLIVTALLWGAIFVLVGPICP